jgi:hypothetical protein
MRALLFSHTSANSTPHFQTWAELFESAIDVNLSGRERVAERKVHLAEDDTNLTNEIEDEDGCDSRETSHLGQGREDSDDSEGGGRSDDDDAVEAARVSRFAELCRMIARRLARSSA